MRIVKVCVCVVLLCGVCALSARAQTVDEVYREQLQASGGEELLEALPEETKQLLAQFGITSLEAEKFAEADTAAWLDGLWAMVQAVAGEPLAACGAVLGIVLLYAWVDGMRHTLRTEESGTVFGAVCALAACGAMMVPLCTQIEKVCAALQSVSVFMVSFVPVYAGVLITGGRATAAVSFQSVVLYAAELLAWLSGAVIVPLLTVSLALGLTGSLTPELKLGKVGELIGKVSTWLLTLGTVVFTGILSLQSLAGNATDRLSDRALRFSVAHFVPVVGASLSEAFTTVRSCLHLLRSTIGCLGIAATLLIVLPPIVGCLLWNAMLSISETAAEMFELGTFAQLVKTAHGVMRCLLGVLCLGGMLLTVSIAVIAITAGGGT